MPCVAWSILPATSDRQRAVRAKMVNVVAVVDAESMKVEADVVIVAKVVTAVKAVAITVMRTANSVTAMAVDIAGRNSADGNRCMMN